MIIRYITWCLGAIGCLSACSSSVMLPPATERIDSAAWDRCAREAQLKKDGSMIGYLTLADSALLCHGVVLSRDPDSLDEALEMLTEAAVRNKEDHRAYYLSGIILVRAGRYEEALSAFVNSQKRYPLMEVPAERMGRTLAAEVADAAAVTFLKAAHRRNVCAYGCKGYLATLLLRADKQQEASALFQEMIVDDPQEPAGYVGMASVMNGQGEHVSEAEMLNQAIHTTGFDRLPASRRAAILYSLAFAHYTTQAYSLARRALDDALLLEDRADWIVLLGWIYAKMNDPAMALVKFETALDKDATISAAHIGRGDALRQLGRCRDAIVAYDAGLAGDSHHHLAALHKVECLIAIGDTEQATVLFKNTLSLAPGQLPDALVKKIANQLTLEPDTATSSETAEP